MWERYCAGQKRPCARRSIVRHLSDGMLRRIYDEPLALTAADQAHFDGCADCNARFCAIANEARSTAALLSVPAFEPQANAALTAVQVRIKRAEAANPPRPYERWLDRSSPRWRPLATPAIGGLLAAALLTGLGVSGIAQSLVRVFEPQQLQAVQVSPSDFGQTSALLDYGNVKWLPEPPKVQQLTDAAAAQAQSGLPVLTPASLPNGISGPVSYGVVSHATGSLTFDAARLQASAAKGGGRRCRKRDERADARDCADPSPNPRLEWRDHRATRGLPAFAARGAARARGAGEGDQGSEHDASDPNPKRPGDDGVHAGEWNACNADQGGPRGGRGLGEEWRNLRRRRSVDFRPGARHCNVPPLIAST